MNAQNVKPNRMHIEFLRSLGKGTNPLRQKSIMAENEIAKIIIDDTYKGCEERRGVTH